MILGLRLVAASVVFGGWLVWWAMAAVAVMSAWLVLGGALGLAMHACRRRRGSA